MRISVAERMSGVIAPFKPRKRADRHALKTWTPDSALDDGSVLLDVLSCIRRSPGKLAGAALMGMLLGGAYTLPQPKIYQATATIEIQELNDNFMDVKNTLPVSDVRASSLNGDIQTQVRIITSNTLIQRVLDKLPREQTVPESALHRMWRKVRGVRDPGSPARDELIDRARKHLSVKESRLTRIVDVAYDSPDP